MRLPRSARRARKNANAASAPADVNSTAPSISAPAWLEPELSGGATTSFVRATAFAGLTKFVCSTMFVAGTGAGDGAAMIFVSFTGSTIGTGVSIATGVTEFVAGIGITGVTGFVAGGVGNAGAVLV